MRQSITVSRNIKFRKCVNATPSRAAGARRQNEQKARKKFLAEKKIEIEIKRNK